MKEDSKPCSPNQTWQTSGFTLVELLIVVAVLAILIALLAPSLSKALEKAKLTACMNNQQQNFQSFTSRTEDYAGGLPRGGSDNLTGLIGIPGNPINPYRWVY
ncbi:MAG: prepilin-type N-terminal cleavage/methylation domain-containing protein, partial [Planctomycetes bacterium]|nr:prepilin-type N-terminal cleavage/methylation domain-containing protein [Planctomycetota bacterium]